MPTCFLFFFFKQYKYMYTAKSCALPRVTKKKYVTLGRQ